jgi:citrate lyase subunit beta/citryl-CoA lyase
MRSLLFIPAHKLSYLDKLKKNSFPDAIVFDLEDSVPKNQKEDGIMKIQNFFNRIINFNNRIYIRIDIEDKQIDKTLKKIIHKNLTGIILPKINNVKEILNFEKKIKNIENKKKIKKKLDILILIETSKAILNLEKIAISSSRIKGLIFGHEDMVNDLNYLSFQENPNTNFIKSKINLVARANNLISIDSPYLYPKNTNGLKKYIAMSKKFCFDGLLLIHSNQINVANSLYKPSIHDYKISKKIIYANKSGKYKGLNISILNGKLVGPPMFKRAIKIIENYKK